MSEYLSDGSMGFGDSGAEPGVTWVVKSGIVKPSDFSTLAKFQELQRQISRVLVAKGKAPIAVDGDIGPGTVAAYNTAMGTTVSAVTLAGSVSIFTQQLAAVAASLNAPAKVSTPAPASPPAITKASGATQVQPPLASNPIAASLYDAVGGNPVVALAGVGIVGGIGYMIFFHKKKGRR